MDYVRAILALGFTLVSAACERDSRIAVSDPPGAASAADEAAPADAGEAPVVLFLGTSLTAGLGLPPEQAYPALIQQKMDSAGLRFRAVNAGVSGETSAGALRRLDWLLRQDFDVLVLETGANDMLRGTDLNTTRENIQAIISRVRAAKPDARIVLVGMMAPPNLGRGYTRRFSSIYPELAEENELPLIPFLLDEVAGLPELNQADGIHPNTEGQRRVARNVWQVLEPVLREQGAAFGG